MEFGANITEKQAVKIVVKIAESPDIEWLMKRYPADTKMIEWLWKREDVRCELWQRMTRMSELTELTESREE